MVSLPYAELSQFDEEALMGRLVVNNAMTVNGARGAGPGPMGGWCWMLTAIGLAGAVPGGGRDGAGTQDLRGLAAVWPQLADDPNLGVFAAG